jgi:hypothetical protein
VKIARLNFRGFQYLLLLVKPAKSRDLIIDILRANGNPMTPIAIFHAATLSTNLTRDSIRQLLPRTLRSGDVRLNNDGGYYLSQTLTVEGIRQAPYKELKMDILKILDRHRHRRTTQFVIVQVLQQVLQEQQKAKR